MARVTAAVVVLCAAALLAAAPAGAFTRSEHVIAAGDGTELAATLFVPDGPPPAAGWPAVVFLHGLGGTRADAAAIAQLMGVVGEEYVVLAYDARGHGASDGLIGIDGPAEVADVASVFGWLRDRDDVADDRIGAWGISYGGGAAWNSLAAGLPWATIVPVQTWVDLRSALAPQNLAKSGVATGFVTTLPRARVQPSVFAVLDAALAGRVDEIAGWAAERSSLQALTGLRTPVFLMQGRRDFAFGLDQARRAWRALAGPKRLWIGNHGHAPSTFPGADTAAMLADGKRWFDRFLRGVDNGIDAERPVVIAGAGSTRVTRFDALPGVRRLTVPLAGTATIDARRKVTRRGAVLPRAIEVFGRPTVKVTATATGGFARLVAVLSARTPSGEELVVAGGGVPLAPGRQTVVIRLLDQATFVPRRSRLTLTLGSSSLAQSPANLLYLDLPMPDSARVTIGPATLRVPVLERPLRR